MNTIKNTVLSYTLDDNGRIISIADVRNGRELCLGNGAYGETFRLIYKIGDFEERSIDAADLQDRRF